MRIERLALAVVTAALVACTTTLPLAGRMERSDERFTGSVTGAGYHEGHGHLSLVSSLGATCDGEFTYTSKRRGEGVLACNDGRSGTFRLSGAGNDGTGAGELRGQRFTFLFGSR